MTKKQIMASRNTLGCNAESWLEELYQWADDNDIPELQFVPDEEGDYDETISDYGFWVGLPRNKDKLRTIKELDLSWHNCLEIPSQLRNLTQLKALRFSKSRCGVQPPFYQKTDLPNSISIIPSWISDLASLEELDLSSNNIQVVPNEIGRLKSLKKLYLSGNKISFVGESLQTLENLQVLWLNWNKKPRLSSSTKKNLKNLVEIWVDGLSGSEYGPIEKCSDGLKWITDDGYRVSFIRHDNENLEQEGLAHILSSLGMLR